MKKKILIIIIFFIFIIAIAGALLLFNKNKKDKDQEKNSINNEIDFINESSSVNDEVDNNLDIEKEQEQEKLDSPKDKSNLVKPIAEFEKRITKKPFGIYITPQNSPVQPEKFQGYHTGSDVEYEDANYEVEVFSIAYGEAVLSKWVSGYGGVVIISHNVENENILSLYGHLNPDSLISIGSEVKKGDKIGILGEGGTYETDYERKHLHLGIIKGSKINLKGYVNNESELNGWYDPVEFLKNKN